MNGLGYIIENRHVISEFKRCNLKSIEYIHDILGHAITLDITEIGSEVHCKCQW